MIIQIGKARLYALLLSTILLSCDEEGAHPLSEKGWGDAEGMMSDAEIERVREGFIHRFDQDQDGRISTEERRAAQRKMVKRFDLDRDGKISKQEREAAQRVFQQRRDRWRQRREAE